MEMPLSLLFQAKQTSFLPDLKEIRNKSSGHGLTELSFYQHNDTIVFAITNINICIVRISLVRSLSVIVLRLPETIDMFCDERLI